MGVRTILVLCSVLLAAACNRDGGNSLLGKPAAAPKAPVKSKKGPTADQQTAGMTVAVGIGKAALPLQLKFELAGRPKAGQAARHQSGLAAADSRRMGRLIQVSPRTGSKSRRTQREVALPALDEGGVYRETLQRDADRRMVSWWSASI